MKIAWVTPIFKRGEVSDLGNYGPIFVLCYFSKMLEINLFKCLYKHLLDNNILYKKQSANIDRQLLRSELSPALNPSVTFQFLNHLERSFCQLID